RYYARVSTDSANWVSLGSKATLTDAAGTPQWDATGSTTAAVSWTSGNNPSGAIYRVQASTAADFSGTLVSSLTALTSAVLSGLTTDSTYYLRVKGVNLDGVEGAASVGGSTVTSVAAPGSGSLAASSSTVTASWSAQGNSTSTLYEADLSVDSGFSS